MTAIAFVKMQSCGNDFVVIDAVRQVLPAGINFAALADRKRGIGCDQILILRAAAGDADFDYQIINADGGEVGQCGNGARCAHLFLHSRGLTAKSSIVLQTKTARITTEAAGDEVRAYLPPPVFFAPPGMQTAECYSAAPYFKEKHFYSVSLGNPHAVFMLGDDDGDMLPGLAEVGKQLNAARDIFPDGVNVGFCFVRADGGLDLQVYERGVGITDSCGSGAAAAAAVAIKSGKTTSPVDIKMPGGNLTCGWHPPSSPIWLQAPATEVFSGTVRL
ncbi:MAG: diaminopimelate epimerase [Gammaproteobacteria bacterium]